MLAKPVKLEEGQYKSCVVEETTHIFLYFPLEWPSLRIIPVSGPKAWEWNKSVESPTLRPSILTKWYEGDKISQVCHSYVTDGKVQFLSDCTHEHAGKTMDLLKVEDNE